MAKPELILSESDAGRRAAWLGSAKRALAVEHAGMQALADALDGGLGEQVADAVHVIGNAQGRVILSGVGKSGHIARKIAATMASTGTPAIFVHATEASHGDLGMITKQDVIFVLSNSGETTELKDLLVYSKRFSVPLIAMTGNAASTLGDAADVVLCLPTADEACPIGLAPTTSTTLQLALGDALAVTLLDDKGFTASDFHSFHPGGRLGAALVLVGEIMHGEERLPLAGSNTVMSDALLVMSEKGFGCVGVIDETGRLAGVVTDGDLRRHMSPDLLEKTAGDIMTPSPKTIGPDAIASAALDMLDGKITALFVVEGNRPVGIVHVHDLLRIGVK